MEGPLQASHSYSIRSRRTSNLGVKWAFQSCSNIRPFNYSEIHGERIGYEEARCSGLRRLIASMYHLDLWCAVWLSDILLCIVRYSCFRRTSWWSPQQHYSITTIHFCRMAHAGQTSYAHRWYARVAQPINKRTRNANSPFCTSYLPLFQYCRATGGGSSKSTSPSSETQCPHQFHSNLSFQKKTSIQPHHVQTSCTGRLCANDTHVRNHRFIFDSAGKFF